MFLSRRLHGSQSDRPSIPFFDYLALLPLISMVSSLPIGFGGWGIREGAFVVGLKFIGVSMESAFLISVQVGILSILGTLLIALPLIFTGDLQKLFRASSKFKETGSISKNDPARNKLKFSHFVPEYYGRVFPANSGRFFEAPQYQGLRLSVADFFLPTVGVLILTSLLSRQSDWPKFIVPKNLSMACRPKLCDDGVPICRYYSPRPSAYMGSL